MRRGRLRRSRRSSDGPGAIYLPTASPHRTAAAPRSVLSGWLQQLGVLGHDQRPTAPRSRRRCSPAPARPDRARSSGTSGATEGPPAPSPPGKPRRSCSPPRAAPASPPTCSCSCSGSPPGSDPRPSPAWLPGGCVVHQVFVHGRRRPGPRFLREDRYFMDPRSTTLSLRLCSPCSPSPTTGVALRPLGSPPSTRWEPRPRRREPVLRSSPGPACPGRPPATLVRPPAGPAPSTSQIVWDGDRGDRPPRLAARVFDATVPGTHNFVADGIVVHNSIEQDADVVMFIYRDELYNAESPQIGAPPRSSSRSTATALPAPPASPSSTTTPASPTPPGVSESAGRLRGARTRRVAHRSRHAVSDRAEPGRGLPSGGMGGRVGESHCRRLAPWGGAVMALRMEGG